MGTKMLERSPGELHTYNINRQATNFLRQFEGIVPGSKAASNLLDDTLDYYIRLIEENPVTITSRNAAAMFIRIGKLEAAAKMGNWWFEEKQIKVILSVSPLTDFVPKVLSEIGRLLEKQTFRCTLYEASGSLFGMSLLGPRVGTVPLNGKENVNCFVPEIVNRLIRDMSKAKPMEITLFAEALARLRYKDIDLAMKSITYFAKIKISKFRDEDIPRFLWSLAQLGYPSRDGTDRDELLSTLAWECKNRIHAWDGKELARAVWAFGVLRFNSIQHLLSIICSQFLDKAVLRPADSVKLLWGFSALSHYPGKLPLLKLGRSIESKLDTLVPGDIVIGLLSLIDFGLAEIRVPERIKEMILKSEVSEWTPREAANLIWGLARADCLELDTFAILRRHLSCNPNELTAQAKIDIYRCALHLNIFRPTMARLIPSNLIDACQTAWIAEQRDLPFSPVLAEVLDNLQSLGYSIKEKNPICQGILFAHTACKDEDNQFAVEVVHPPKCFINEPTLLTGRQSWRQDVLAALGWKVLEVNEKRWSKIGDEEKAMYLRTLIDIA